MIIKPPKVPPPPVEFDQTSCKNPCWHGLQVGVSTRQDVQNILNTFPVEPNKIGIDSGEYTSGDQFVKIEFYEEPYRYYMNGPAPIIAFEFNNENDDLVDRIYISDMLRMEQALKVFGDPESVIVYSYEFLPDFWKKDLYLYYPQKGLVISCFEGTTIFTTERPPCHETAGVSITFFYPEEYQDILRGQFGNVELALKYLMPYRGLDAEYLILEQGK